MNHDDNDERLCWLGVAGLSLCYVILGTFNKQTQDVLSKLTQYQRDEVIHDYFNDNYCDYSTIKFHPDFLNLENDVENSSSFSKSICISH